VNVTVIEIAERIARNPHSDHSFQQASRPKRVVDYRHPHWTTEYRTLWVQGDLWSPFIGELTAADWEFVEAPAL